MTDDGSYPGRGGVIDPFAYEEGEAAADEAGRIPRQRGAFGSSAMIGLAAMAAVGATGAAGYPAAASEERSYAGVGVLSIAEPPGQHAGYATGSGHSADPGLALTARLTGQPYEPGHTAEFPSQQTAEESARREAAAAAEARRAEQERVRLVGPLVAPVAGAVRSTPFGTTASYWAHLHNGQDFAARAGAPVLAIGEGEITSAGWAGAYGYRVVQTLRDGTEVWYCHLSAIAVGGGAVAAGQPIARVGATGSATRPHLHLEIREAGEPRDPAAWFAAHGVEL